MGYLLKYDLVEKIRNDISSNMQLKNLWDSLYQRTMDFTRTPQLSKPQDTVKWWHLIWERLGDAAFVCAVMPNEQLKTFVHDVVMDVCNKDIDEWLGPWFRKRTDEKVATLETAHTGIAVAVAFYMCSILFSDEEKKVIFSALREKCQVLCKAFLKNLKTTTKVNNWYMVILDGYITVSCVLNDEKAVKEGISVYQELLKAYSKDSYGESLQYSNYASLHLCHAYEMVSACYPALLKQLDCSVYGNLIKWYVASFMYMKPLYGEWGEHVAYPRSLNFGDSAAIFRPSGDLLIHLSARLKNTVPINAGLARWLFDVTYGNPSHEPCDRSTFGFINNYHYLTIMLFSDSTEAISPQGAGMPLLSSFETGTVVFRDRWENPKLILGIQGGYKCNNVTAHRHFDQNSFIVSYLNERMILDPGHCCYRLYSHRHSVSNEAHSTWTFETEEHRLICQKPVEGNFLSGIQEPMNKLKIAEKIDNIGVISSDCAPVYGEDFIRAERSWIVYNSNVIFIVDRIKTKIPVKVNTHFVVNNRNNMVDERIFYNLRVVIRRNGVGMKLLPLSAETEKLIMERAWGFAHDCYHPEPNNIGQGKEGSALIYKYTTEEYKTKHIHVYALIFDKEEHIKKWHAVVDDNHYRILPPGDQGGVKINIVSDELIQIADCNNNKIYHFDGTDVIEK